MILTGAVITLFATGASLRIIAMVFALAGAYLLGRRRRQARSAGTDGPARPSPVAGATGASSAATPGGGPVPQSSPVEQAIIGVHTGFRALRTVLWHANPAEDRAVPVVVVGGKAPPPVRLSGDVLGWALRERTTLRLTEPPAWTLGAAVSAIAGAIETGAAPALLTAEFLEYEAPAIEEFERVAAYVRAVVAMKEQEDAAIVMQRRIEELLGALRRLPSELDPQAFAGHLVATSITMTGCRGAAVAFWENEQGRVAAVADDEGPPAGSVFAALESEAALAARNGTTIVRTDRLRTGRPLAIMAPAERWYHAPRSAAIVPLIANSSVIGVLATWSDTPIPESAVHDLEVLAPYAALQLLHARDFGEMRLKAQHDRLTGLNNRQRFDERIGQEAGRFQRYGHGYTLLLIDVDHFKSFNDTYGHQAGDAVLKEVARCIAASLREVDFAARYGGEEFAVIAPETKLHAAVDIADRIRTRIQQAEVLWEGITLRVTASVGVAGCPECGSDVDTLVRAADQALYTSKSAGRNRVTAAPARIDPVRGMR